MVGPHGLQPPLDPSRLEPGTVADRRLFAHSDFKAGYRFEEIFVHNHPDITYTLALYLRTDPA